MYLSNLKRSAAMSVLRLSFEERQEFIDSHQYDPSNSNHMILWNRESTRERALFRYYPHYTIDNLYELFVVKNTITVLNKLCRYTGSQSFTLGHHKPVTKGGEHHCANIAWEGGNELIEEERRFKGELQTFRRFLTETYPTGIASIVSDTYNFWRTVSEILPALRKEIMERDGKLVIRPDSGDPVHIVTGYKAIHLECAKKAYYEHLSKLEASDTMLNAVLNMKLENINYGIAGWLLSEGYEMVVDREDFEVADTVLLKNAYMVGSANVVTRPVAEIDGAIKTLYNIFGGTINSKGFKVLDEHIGLIYGDSITLERANEILKRLYEMGFASSNVVFGVGSYTYQYMTRDTFAFAVKATLASIGGKEIMLAKDPKTDSGVKKSAFGGVAPMWDGDKLKAIDGYGFQSFADVLDHPACALRLVFSDSEQFGYTTLGDIRSNIDKQL